LNLVFEMFITYIYISMILLVIRIFLGIYRSTSFGIDRVYNKNDVPPKSIFMLLYIAPQWPRPKFWRRWSEVEW